MLAQPEDLQPPFGLYVERLRRASQQRFLVCVETLTLANPTGLQVVHSARLKDALDSDLTWRPLYAIDATHRRDVDATSHGVCS